MLIENINNSFIKYNPHFGCSAKDYYLYCVDLLKKFLTNQKKSIIFLLTQTLKILTIQTLL